MNNNATAPVLVPGIKFARLNKQQDLAGYQHEVALGSYHTETVAVAEVLFLSPAEFDAFAGSMLADDARIAGKGGHAPVSLADAPFAVQREGVGYVRQCVLVVAPGRPSLYVDPQGYKYARYVGV